MPGFRLAVKDLASARGIVINASHVGEHLNGIGTYAIQLISQWTSLPSQLHWDVYLHEKARFHFNGIRFPENFQLHWISKRLFGDKANLRRFLYSSLLAAAGHGRVVFHASQLETGLIGPKQIITVHDLIPLDTNARNQRMQRYFFRFVLPHGLANAAAIVTASQDTGQAICSRFGISPEKVRIIPHGVRSQAVRNTPNHNHRVIPQQKYILFAGRVTPYRNIDRLIQAFERIQGRIDHDLVVAGELQPGYHAARGNARISFRGYVSDEELFALYRGASAFVFPSLQEGFGLTVLEAMACGCPVIVSHQSSLPEVCRTAAFFVDPYNVDNIAAGIETVVLNEGLRSILIDAGLRRAAEFSWMNSAKLHLRLFEEVAQ